jgi:hypothetical protein
VPWKARKSAEKARIDLGKLLIEKSGHPPKSALRLILFPSAMTMLI